MSKKGVLLARVSFSGAYPSLWLDTVVLEPRMIALGMIMEFSISHHCYSLPPLTLPSPPMGARDTKEAATILSRKKTYRRKPHWGRGYR